MNVDFVLDLMTILSFLTSSILFICKVLYSRKKVDFEIIDYVKVGHVVQLFAFIYNKSSSSISISSICINHDNRYFQCELIPKKIIKREENLITTPPFPLNLNPQESRSCFLEFLYCKEISVKKGNLLSLTIHTNRGKITKDLYLPDKSHYLHIG